MLRSIMGKLFCLTFLKLRYLKTVLLKLANSSSWMILDHLPSKWVNSASHLTVMCFVLERHLMT
jgi:hypothetical protein